MKYRVIVEYEYPVEHKTPVKAELTLHGDRVETWDIKPLEQEPRKGKWIEHFDESGKWYECDQCHTDWGGAVNFCPNCGADMRGEE